MKALLRILMCFCLAANAAVTIPDWAKGNTKVVNALKLNNADITAFVDQQYKDKGAEGLKDPTFTAQLDSKVVAYKATQKAKVRPQSAPIRVNPDENGGVEDAPSTEAGTCPGGKDCPGKDADPIPDKAIEPIREVVRAPPPSVRVETVRVEQQSTGGELFSTSNLLWGLGGLAIGGLAGYMIGKNNSQRKYSVDPGLYGYGQMPGYNPYHNSPYYMPRYNSLPLAYRAPGYGNQMPPAYSMINHNGLVGFNSYNGFNGGGIGNQFGGGFGIGGLNQGGLAQGGIFGPAPIALPFPGPSYGIGATPYGFR